jgi:hypothetical protein
MKNDVVEFDGTVLKLGGSTHPLPELRAAIKAGWLSPVESSVEDYIPQSSNMKVRPAMDRGKGNSVSTEVQQDETHVGNIRKANTTDGVRIESKVFNSTVIRDTEGDGRSVGSSTKKPSVAFGGGSSGGASSEGEAVSKIKTSAKQSFSLDGSTSMNVSSEEGSEEPGFVESIQGLRQVVRSPGNGESLTREGQSSDGGKVIANVKTAAKRKVTLTDADSAEREISKLDNSTRAVLAPRGKRDIAALAGDTLEEIVPANEPENRGKALADQAKAQRLAALKAREAQESEKVKARVLQEESLRIEEFDAANPEEGDLPDAEDSPIPVKVIDAVAPVKVTAKSPKSVEDFAVNGDELELAPGVRWSKKLHWKSRVKLALQYRTRPEILNLIRGYEVPSVVKSIDEALASSMG